MALISLQEPPGPPPSRWRTAFALAFRPFFLAAGFAGCALIWGWVAFHSASMPGLGSGYYDAVGWHGHEMVFGFVGAVLAGFLLTAARNWTGGPTLRGLALGGLFLLWLGGRLLPLCPTTPPWVLVAVDVAFLPLAALALATPLLRARHYKSLLFVALLLLLAVANGALHLEYLGFRERSALPALRLGVTIEILLITIMGGRVIPFFTEKALPGTRPARSWSAVERLSAPSLLLVALGEVVAPQALWTAAAALGAAAVHGVRLTGWYQGGIWRVPLLWVLHLGYGWLVLGLLLRALAWAEWLSVSLAMHALTAGALGAVTLGMMARVSLGHTGRTLRLPRGVASGFVAVVIAAVLRVPVAWAVPEHYPLWVTLSGALWGGAFLLFFLAYWPILTRPRPDGRPE